MPKQDFYNESQLIILLKQKDQNAFAYLYDHYCEALNGIISRAINTTNPDDLLQDVFVKIWNNFHQFDPLKSSLFTWMAAIARNCSIDFTRTKVYKLSVKIAYDESILSFVCDSPFNLSKHDHLGIERYLKILTPTEKAIVCMAYYNGQTHVEISRHTGLPMGTIKTSLRNSIKKLRLALDETHCAVA